MESRVWSTNSRVVPQTSKIKSWFSTLATSKHSKLNITTALGDPLFGNCGGKWTGVVGGQTVRSMGCAANQRNIVCQSNYALKAINGAGNDLTRLENKRRSGSADLTRLEKSDLSRDFFSCLDCDSDRKDFLEFFGFSLKIFCENGGANIHAKITSYEPTYNVTMRK